MRSSVGLLSIAMVTVVVAGCGSPSPTEPLAEASATPADPNQLYRTGGLVFELEGKGPKLCLGGANDTIPPGCESIDLVHWSWDDVEGEDETGGAVWGEFDLVGRYDGETFTVVKAGPLDTGDPSQADAIDTPCTEPVGGWVATDQARASLEVAQEIQTEVSDDDDFVGLWLDYYNVPPKGPTEEDPGDIILNVSFTADLERHEQELRELWGGPLCVTEGGKTYKELREIQRTFDAAEFGLEGLWSDIDVTKNVVMFGVVIADEEALQQIEEQYGPGVVKIIPRLVPVEK